MLQGINTTETFLSAAMKLVCFVAMLTSSHALPGEDMDHDETLLLQTRATTIQAEELDELLEPYEASALDEGQEPETFSARKVNHYTVNVHDDGVSLVQGKSATHDSEHVLYSGCASTNDGIAAESDDGDGGPTYDSCGEIDIFDADGEYLGAVDACTPQSVAAGECYDFTAPANFYETISQSTGMINLPVQQSSDEVSLISVPAMDEDKLPSALDVITKEVTDFSNQRVLFTGSGAKLMRNHYQSQRGTGLFGFLSFMRNLRSEQENKKLKGLFGAQMGWAARHPKSVSAWGDKIQKTALSARNGWGLSK